MGSKRRVLVSLHWRGGRSTVACADSIISWSVANQVWSCTHFSIPHHSPDPIHRILDQIIFQSKLRNKVFVLNSLGQVRGCRISRLVLTTGDSEGSGSNLIWSSCFKLFLHLTPKLKLVRWSVLFISSSSFFYYFL